MGPRVKVAVPGLDPRLPPLTPDTVAVRCSTQGLPVTPATLTRGPFHRPSGPQVCSPPSEPSGAPRKEETHIPHLHGQGPPHPFSRALSENPALGQEVHPPQGAPQAPPAVPTLELRAPGPTPHGHAEPPPEPPTTPARWNLALQLLRLPAREKAPALQTCRRRRGMGTDVNLPETATGNAVSSKTPEGLQGKRGSCE